jgi:hypothetical protein
MEVVVIEYPAPQLTPATEADRMVAFPAFVDVYRRTATAGFTRPPRNDRVVIPVPRAPTIVEGYGQLGEIAQPPPRKPRERLVDRGPIEQLVECLIDLR